jgi:hypothetical protein
MPEEARMKLLVVFLLALAQIGCGQLFNVVDGNFIAYNRTDRNIVVVVGTREIPLAPNSEFAFTMKIEIATPRSDFGGTGPSPVDRTTQVSVVWRDLWSKQTSSVWTCNAGAKITTRLVYSVTGTIQNPYCDTLESY